MANPIVTVNVSQTVAPTPSNLQKTGALVSQGGTVMGIGGFSLLTQLSDLTALLSAGLAITSISYSGGVATATTTSPHGVPTNSTFSTTIAGAVPAAYNGTYFATATGASTFTYYPTSNPGGAATTPGTYTPPTTAELVAMATTFFTQNPGSQGVYVLELGAGTAAAGVTALSAFITAQPHQMFYSYEVPRNWADESTFITFAETFTSPSAKTYFFVTVNLQNDTLWTAAAAAGALKSVLAIVEAPKYSKLPTQTISTASFLTGIVTATTGAPHGILPNDTFTIVGVTPTGYNGTFIALPGTTGSTLKYALAADPGAYVSGGALVTNIYGSSAGIPATEFDASAPLFTTLNYNPSPTNKVTPLFASFVFGVTPFPTLGNAALVRTIDTANINYIATGAEGGISNDILFEGHMLDGRPFNYWYSVDWMQITIKQQLAATIINGSNNQINPLYYDQDGIDRLQNTVVSTCGQGVSNGLVLGKVLQTELDAVTFTANLNAGKYAGNCVVNAIPFTSYLTANPSHYKLGIYNGLSVTFSPTRAFESITVNLNVTDFVVA